MKKNLHLKFARTVYRLAEQENQQEEIYLQLRALNDSFSKREVRLKFKNLYDLDLDQIVAAVAKLKLNKLAENLLVMLWVSKLTDLLPAIFENFQKIYFSRANLANVEVITAREFSEKEIENFFQTLSGNLKQKPVITTKISPELIGGVQIIKDGRMTDLSLRARLNQLKQVLSN